MAEKAVRKNEVQLDKLAAFEVDGHRVAVANVGGTFYAFDDTCTHRQCSLAEGTLEGTTVTCPCHGSQFDVKTGGGPLPAGRAAGQELQRPGRGRHPEYRNLMPEALVIGWGKMTLYSGRRLPAAE